jgi:hypothetical protein
MRGRSPRIGNAQGSKEPDQKVDVLENMAQVNRGHYDEAGDGENPGTRLPTQRASEITELLPHQWNPVEATIFQASNF